MDKASLNALVVSITGRSDKTALINIALDLALKAIGRRHDFQFFFEETELSVTGSSVTKPTGYKRFIEARIGEDTQAYSIALRPKAFVVSRYPSIPTGNPVYMYETSTTFVLAPEPTDETVMTLTYVKEPSFSTTGSLDEMLAEYACAFIFKSIQMPDVAMYWTQEFERHLREAILDDKRTNVLYIHEGFAISENIAGAAAYLDPFQRHD